MLEHWKIAACVPLVGAALALGCNRADVDKGTANAEVTPKAADARPVALTGCVSSGIGTDQYMLTQVRFAPPAEQPSDALANTAIGITEHSQVRLAIEDKDQLRNLVGQVASVTGAIKDDGRNTIGTTGPAAGPGDPQSRTDQSQAATKQDHSEKVAKEAGPIGQQSMANGTFPEIQVQKISGTGQRCQTQPVEDKR